MSLSYCCWFQEYLITKHIGLLHWNLGGYQLTGRIMEEDYISIGDICCTWFSSSDWFETSSLMGIIIRISITLITTFFIRYSLTITQLQKDENMRETSELLLNNENYPPNFRLTTYNLVMFVPILNIISQIYGFCDNTK